MFCTDLSRLANPSSFPVIYFRSWQRSARFAQFRSLRILLVAYEICADIASRPRGPMRESGGDGTRACIGGGKAQAISHILQSGKGGAGDSTRHIFFGQNLFCKVPEFVVIKIYFRRISKTAQ